MVPAHRRMLIADARWNLRWSRSTMSTEQNGSEIIASYIFAIATCLPIKSGS
jgi:hypothetical protein